MSLLQAGFGSSGDDYEITDSLRLRSSASAYLSRTPSSTSCLLYTSPSPRDAHESRMPSSA